MGKPDLENETAVACTSIGLRDIKGRPFLLISVSGNFDRDAHSLTACSQSLAFIHWLTLRTNESSHPRMGFRTVNSFSWCLRSQKAGCMNVSPRISRPRACEHLDMVICSSTSYTLFDVVLPDANYIYWTKPEEIRIEPSDFRSDPCCRQSKFSLRAFRKDQQRCRNPTRLCASQPIQRREFLS